MRRRYPGKPPFGAEIDSDNPITQGLLFCSPFLAGSGVESDLVNNQRKSTVTRPTWAARSALAARDWEFPNASTPELDWTAGAFSFAAFFHIDALPNSNEYPSIFSWKNYVSESSNQGWEIYLTASNNIGNARAFATAVFRNNAEANYKLNGASNAVTLGDHMVVGTSDGTTRKLYVDGRLINTTTTQNITPVSQTTFGIHNLTTGGASNPVYIGYAWKRALLFSEQAELWDDPYCVLRFDISRFAGVLAIPYGFQCDGIGGLSWTFASPGFQCDGIGSLDWTQVDAGNAWQMDGVGGLEWTTNYWTMDGGSACTWDVPAAVTLGAFQCDGIGGLEWRTQAGVPVNCATPDDSPIGGAGGVSAVVNKMF